MTTEILQFVRQASTKTQTELGGSHTLFFEDGEVFAYNNVIGVVAGIDYDICGSINAEKFCGLIQRIGSDIKLKDTEAKLVIKYGKHTATLRKEKDALKMYKNMVFPDKYTKHLIGDDFLEALSILKLQNHKSLLSGVYIDENIVYMLNSQGIAYYTPQTAFSECFWIPRGGVELLLNLPNEQLRDYALSSSFLYVFGESFIVAVKLKIANQYPLSQVLKIKKLNTDFSKTIKIPASVLETMDRIKLSTIANNDKKLICSICIGKELIIKSMGDGDIIEEHLEYTNTGVEPKTIIVPVDTFLTLYKECINGVVCVHESDGVFLSTHNEKRTYLLKVNTKE